MGNDVEKINEAFNDLTSSNWKQSKEIPLWDGKAAKRIIDAIIKIYDL